MKRQLLNRALTFGLAASAMVLAGCSTVESRMSDHPEIYQSLSPTDQGLVSRGEIRFGMSQNAVWMAWGSADQKVVGNMRGKTTETWIYLQGTTSPYYYPYGPYRGGYGYGRYGFGYVGVSAGHFHHHGGRGFLFYGDPFYDPFFYSYIPPTIYYPYKTVTFSNGRVMSFQFLVPGGY
jgi:hypothetical protein